MRHATLEDQASVQATCAAVDSKRDRPALSLRMNFSWMLVGNVVYAGCQFAMLVVLARRGSTEIVGQFALATAVAAPIMTFSMLHLRALLATDVRGEYKFGEFMALRLLTTTGGWLAMIAVAWFIGYSDKTIWLIAAAGMISASDAISDVLHGAFQRRERLDYAGLAFLLKGPLGLTVVFLLMALHSGLIRAMLALAISRWLVLLLFEFPCARIMLADSVEQAPLRPVWHRERLLRLAWTALPLGAVIFLMSLRSNVPRYVLEHYAGAEALGIFAGILAMTQIGALAVNASGQAASPRLAYFYATGQSSAFLRLTWQLVLLGGLLGTSALFVVVFAGEHLLVIFFGSDFGNETSVFVVLMAAAAVAYAGGPLGYAATASKRIRRQPLIHLISLLITGMIAWYSVRWGVIGVSWAVFVGATLKSILFLALLFTRSDEHANGTDTVATADLPITNDRKNGKCQRVALPSFRRAA